MMNDIIFCGYISVEAAIKSTRRPINKLLFDTERYNTIQRSGYHYSEKKQYSYLKKYCADNNVPITYMTPEEFSTATSGESCGGIAAAVGERRFNRIEELIKQNAFIVILDGIEDPYNFGFVLRSLYAAGVDGVVVPRRNFFTAASIIAKASAGASELIKSVETDDVFECCRMLKNNGFELSATAKTENSINLYDYNPHTPLCVLIGGERRGISKKTLDICDNIISIEYPRAVDFSLSAASASAIIAFEIARKIENGGFSK